MKKAFIFIQLMLSLCVAMAQSEGNACIFIKRPAIIGATLVHYIELNGVCIGQVNGGECYKINVAPGSYVLNYYQAPTVMGIAFNTNWEKIKQNGPDFSIPRMLQAGENLYVQIKINFGVSAGRPTFVIKNDDKEFSNYKEIDFSVYQKISENEAMMATSNAQEIQEPQSIQSQQSVAQETAPIVATGNVQGIQEPQTIQSQQIDAQEAAPIIPVVEQPSLTQAIEKQLSDVDTNIPQTNNYADDVFVLIIANEKYQFLDNVNYAMNDGETFKEYCIKTLGVPERQIRYCPNASYGIISGGVDWLRYALENFEGSKGIVYYCGHGIPDEKTGAAYIIPVDGKGTNTTTCHSLNELYKTLATTNATNITYFMDACFTGANKEGSMLVAARDVAREPKKETLEGKTVVFSASSGDETAMTYEEKQHGLFTYYLLKKLQETEGDVSYEELANYISKNVKKDAFLLNEKPQNPVVATSPAASSSWKSMRMK